MGSSGGQPAPPPTIQDVTVSAANAPTSGGSTPVSSSAVVIQTGTIRPASSASGVSARYDCSLYYGVHFVNECHGLDLVVLLPWPQRLQVRARASLVQVPRLAPPPPAHLVLSLV